jgi:hypothetical protein
MREGHMGLRRTILDGQYANRIAFAFGITALTATTLGAGLGGLALPAFLGATALAPSLGHHLGKLQWLDPFRGNLALTLTLLCASATRLLGPATPIALLLATGTLQTVTGSKYLAEQHSHRTYHGRHRRSAISQFIRGDFANRILVGYGLGGVAALVLGAPEAAALGFLVGTASSQRIGERLAPTMNRFPRGPSAMFLLATSLTLFSGIFILGGAAPAVLPLAVHIMMGVTGLKFITESVNAKPASYSTLNGRARANFYKRRERGEPNWQECLRRI